MTAEHLKPLLDSTNCSQLFGEVATQFAGSQNGQDDGTSETEWERSRDRGGRCVSRAGGPNNREAVCQAGGSRDTPVPVRTLHARGDGVCGPHRAGIDASR